MKSRIIRRVLAAVFVVLCLVVLFIYLDGYEPERLPLYDYVIDYFYETGAKNLVAAVYLNYRIFDTILEALLLLVAVMCSEYLLEGWELE